MLEELARQGDKIIVAQLRASEEGDDKSEQILAVALLVMAGGAAAARLVVSNHARPDGPFMILLVGGLACAAVAFWHVGLGYLGAGREAVNFRIGWDPRELARIAVSGQYSRPEILQAHVVAVHEWAADNAELLARFASQRIFGAWFLFGAGFLLGLAFLYGLLK